MRKPLFAGTTGLNTKLDPARLQLQENGLRALVRGQNLRIDDSGRIGRCGGFSLVQAGDFRSGGPGLVVKDGWLCTVDQVGGTTPIQQLTAPEQPIDFHLYRDRIYWGNGVECGYVADGLNHAWVQEDWGGPDTDKIFGMPVPHLLTELYAALWAAVENGICVSMPGYPGAFWLDGDVIECDGPPRLLKALDHGVWYGDDAGIHWVQDETEATPAPSRAIPGTAVYVEDHPYEVPGKGVRVLTEQGLCFLGPEGFFVNETKHTIEVSKKPFTSSHGAAAVWDGQYIGTIEP